MKDIVTLSCHNKSVCTCPHCDSTSLTRSGFDRDTQRYRCKNCRKTFKATAGTPVHGLHKKEKIAKYLEALQAGMSVRKAAQFVDISKNTSFAWRHKFLSSLEARSAMNTANEISSAEIIQLEYSAKGRRKPPEKHTSPTKTIALLKDGQMELHKLAPMRQIRHATQVISETSSYFFAAAPNKTVTESIKHSESAVKIQNRQASQQLITEAKQQTTRLLYWMERFKGVASKYLQNYWNWYASLLNMAQLKQEAEHFSRICTNSRSLSLYFDTKTNDFLINKNRILAIAPGIVSVML